MKSTDQKAQKFCLSLRRFSSEKQSGNTSLTRQQELAQAIADRNGWTLREDWGITQEAVSAYKKHNFPALLALIDDVKKGVIPPGTVVVVEKIDRLTRASLDEGREMLRLMLLADIELCDSEGYHYTKADLNDIVKLLTMCLRITAANEYSANISIRVKKANQIRASRIAKGEVLLTNQEGFGRKDVPAWIVCNGKGFELNERAEIFGSIFADYLNNVGSGMIARNLNKNGVKSIRGKGAWSQSIVYRILSDRRTIGEIKANGQTVKGYYPSLITEETFLTVQAKLQDNRGKRPVGNKSTGQVTNLFGGIGYCTCGEKIKVVNGHGGKFITCYGKINGTKDCKAPMTKYLPFEQAALTILKLNPSQLLTDDNGEGMNAQVQILNGRKAETQKEIDHITGLGMNLTKALVARQAELENQVEEINNQLALESAKTVANKGSMEKLIEILDALHNVSSDVAARIKVHAWYVENCNRITFNRIAKTFDVDLKNGSLISMDINGTILGTKSLASVMALGKGNDIAANVLHRINKVA
jgi:DNA invertase Pin-like site-specific DNA recombinase